KCAAGSAHDDDSHLALLIEPARNVDKFSQHRAIHRVQSFRAIECKSTQRPIDFSLDRLEAHLFLTALITPQSTIRNSMVFFQRPFSKARGVDESPPLP